MANINRLIAIMLGRLEMNVDERISAYSDLEIRLRMVDGRLTSDGNTDRPSTAHPSLLIIPHGKHPSLPPIPCY
jgi:hypothetical protein